MADRIKCEPDVSVVVVVVYNLPREVTRTLLSLSTSYRRHSMEFSERNQLE